MQVRPRSAQHSAIVATTCQRRVPCVPIPSRRPRLARAPPAPPMPRCRRRNAPADSEPVKQLLAEKLGVAGASADAVWNAAAPAWDAASAADPHAAAADLAAGLDSLLQVLTRDEAARALAAQPALVAAPLASWRAFFDAMGFSHAEQRAMIVQCPEVRPAKRRRGWLARGERLALSPRLHGCGTHRGGRTTCERQARARRPRPPGGGLHPLRLQAAARQHATASTATGPIPPRPPRS